MIDLRPAGTMSDASGGADLFGRDSDSDNTSEEALVDSEAAVSTGEHTAPSELACTEGGVACCACRGHRHVYEGGRTRRGASTTLVVVRPFGILKTRYISFISSTHFPHISLLV